MYVDVLAGCSIETRPEFVLIARPGTYDNDGDIGCLSCGYCLGESRLIVGPALSSLGIRDRSSACRLDTIVGCDTPVLSQVWDIVAVLFAG